jgi:rubrerythrin
VREFDEQIQESSQHAAQYWQSLEMTHKRFDALTRVEERHAGRYQDALTKIST